jgi:hypothetical protein
VIAALLLAVAPVLPPELPLPSHAKVGEWVTYRLEGRYWRIAAVAHDAEGLWLELEFGDHPALKAPMAAFKLLVSGDRVSRAILALGADAPREIPPADLQRFFPRDPPRGPPPVDPSIAVKTGRLQPLLTSHGTVTARPVEVRLRTTVIKRLWLCDAIPLLGLAKLELPALGYAMEAYDWGSDAQPRVASRIPMEHNETSRIP